MTDELYGRFTMLLASAALVPAIVLFAHSVSHPKMSIWKFGAFSLFSIFLASLLGSLRGVIPDTIAILASNLFISIGYAFGITAIRKGRSCKKYRYAEVIILVICTHACILNFILGAQYTIRAAQVSTCIFLYSVQILLLISGTAGQVSRLGDALLVTFAATNAALSGLRAVSAVFGTHAGIPPLEMTDPIFFIWSIAAMFAFATGIFINGHATLTRDKDAQLHRERTLTQQLNAAIEDQNNLQKFLLHELKRPLNAMSCALQTARHPPPGQRGEAEIHRLNRLVEEANSYLDAIGEYEELSALLDTPTLQPLNISAIVADLETKWSIRAELQPGLGAQCVQADPLLIDIALGNLIENARKFGTGRVPCQIQISCEAGLLHFDVIDDGPGIAPEHQANVWKKFWKTGAPSRNAAKGCGLGLYLVQRIAHLHGGAAQVLHSAPSTLRLTLPLIN